ncbi:MAG: cyclic nucleotide-binding domain-containing protein [Anaerolineae bacterium]|nr:cyclic nucleotide-binding domain-containing protein [Anaerolineae bacterium]
MTLTDLLKKVPLFADLQDDMYPILAEMGQHLSLAAGAVICNEGDISDSLYVILTGRVRVYKMGSQGNDIELSILEATDFFGEMSILDSKPRSASVLCLTDCELFILNKAAFTRLMLDERSQRVIFPIFSTLVSRIRDTTTKFFEGELSQQAQKSQMEIERHRALNQMVAGVAHELNTPLGIVNTAVDMIANRLNQPQVAALFAEDRKLERMYEDLQEAASLTTRNISRAHTLVQNFKKISVNQLTDTLETVDLPQTVTEIVDLFRISARKAKLEIEIHNQVDAAEATWTGYAGHLSQILLNLLSNIERYAYPDGSGGKVEVTIASEREDGFTLSVRDYGQGIDPQHLSQVFEPFFTTGRSKGGTGLGMAIVRNLVTEGLKGTVQIASTPGQGTAIEIQFPRVIEA